MTKSKILYVRVSQSTYEQLKQVADHQEWTISKTIGVAIRQMITQIKRQLTSLKN